MHCIYFIFRKHVLCFQVDNVYSFSNVLRKKEKISIHDSCFFCIVEINYNQSKIDQSEKKHSRSVSHVHFIGAVVLGAERGGDGHHHGGAAVAEEVEVAVQEALVVDDPHHDEVQVDALDAHPGERRQEEVVEQPGDHRAEELETGGERGREGEGGERGRREREG